MTILRSIHLQGPGSGMGSGMRGRNVPPLDSSGAEIEMGSTVLTPDGQKGRMASAKKAASKYPEGGFDPSTSKNTANFGAQTAYKALFASQTPFYGE